MKIKRVLASLEILRCLLERIMDKSVSISKVIGGTLLVGGTAIGAGMLALPVVTGFGGFLPATVIYLICYLFSAATGLLLLEVCYWMPQDANIVSMAKLLLGPFGKIGAWILYLFLFYSLTIAYVAWRFLLVYYPDILTSRSLTNQILLHLDW